MPRSNAKKADKLVRHSIPIRLYINILISIISLGLSMCSRMESDKPTRVETPTLFPTHITIPTDTVIPTEILRGDLLLPLLEYLPTIVPIPCPTDISAKQEPVLTADLTNSDVLREFTGWYGYWTSLEGATLLINCDGSYVSKALTDSLAEDPSIKGKIIIDNGQMILIGLEEDAESQTALLPVRWGARKYLIGMNEVKDFCVATKKTTGLREPRVENGFGRFYLRIGDDSLEATGDPILPSGKNICQ